MVFLFLIFSFSNFKCTHVHMCVYGRYTPAWIFNNIMIKQWDDFVEEGGGGRGGASGMSEPPTSQA